MQNVRPGHLQGGEGAGVVVVVVLLIREEGEGGGGGREKCGFVSVAVMLTH